MRHPPPEPPSQEEQSARRRWTWVPWLLALFVIALALGCVLVFPRLLYPPLTKTDLQARGVSNAREQVQLQDARLKLQNDARTTLLQALGGLLVLGTAAVGAFTAWRQLQDNRLQQQRNEELTREGQVTERFSRAVEHLGSGKLDVTLGGIYALERIARDSPLDRAAIADVLSAYIRNRLPGSDDEGYVEELQRRAPDAQAALTVLGRSPLCDERVASSDSPLLDLSRTDLRRANLQRARLDRVNLWNARLQGANLREAHLEGSILKSVNFGPFDPNNPHYQHGADLSHANLTGAQLGGAIDLDRALTEGTIWR
jgi:hypothetical protein